MKSKELSNCHRKKSQIRGHFPSSPSAYGKHVLNRSDNKSSNQLVEVQIWI